MELATTYNAIHYYMASAHWWMTYYYCRCFCVRFQVRVGADTEAGCSPLSDAENCPNIAGGQLPKISIITPRG
jgi:hypothetical protein